MISSRLIFNHENEFTIYNDVLFDERIIDKLLHLYTKQLNERSISCEIVYFKKVFIR